MDERKMRSSRRHRDLALFLIRGVQPARQIFAQYYGGMGGLKRGRDGNMQGAFAIDIVAIISVWRASVTVFG